MVFLTAFVDDFPYLSIKVDPQQREDTFDIWTYQGDAPRVRAFTYVDGARFTVTNGYIGLLQWGTNFQWSTEWEAVTTTVSVVTNYVDFDFPVGKLTDHGTYYTRMLLSNSVSGRQMVMGTGKLHVQQ